MNKVQNRQYQKEYFSNFLLYYLIIVYENIKAEIEISDIQLLYVYIFSICKIIKIYMLH